LYSPPISHTTVDNHRLLWRGSEDCSQLLSENGKAANDNPVDYIFIAFQAVDDLPLLLKALIYLHWFFSPFSGRDHTSGGCE
jgi:hypothetical protein